LKTRRREENKISIPVQDYLSPTSYLSDDEMNEKVAANLKKNHCCGSCGAAVLPD
jgi:hypothetical protein